MTAEANQKELILIIHPDGYGLDWQDAGQQEPNSLELQEKLFAGYHKDPFSALFELGFLDEKIIDSVQIRFLWKISAEFIKILSSIPEIEFLRDRAEIRPEVDTAEKLLSSAPYILGGEYLDTDWIMSIWNSLNEAFSTKIRNFEGSVTEYLLSMNPKAHIAGRIYFHLVESKKEDYPFAFLATYSQEITKKSKKRHLPLKNALIEYKEDNDKLLELLSTVNKAARGSTLISGILESGEIFHPLSFSSSEALTFLKEVSFYENCGILCRIPNWWRKRSNAVRLSVNIGDKQPSRVGFDAILEFDARISIGNDELTVEELRKLLGETEGLAFIKGKWVEVDHEKLKKTLDALEKANELYKDSELSILEAMRFQMDAVNKLEAGSGDVEIEVSNGKWLDSFLHRISHTEDIEEISYGDDFKAVLRPYQQKGVNWLNLMKKLGLGACLADDMGLGKTVQIIALLNHLKTQENTKTLLVLPASLIGNWVHETARFAPSLRAAVLHPSEDKTGPELLVDNDLFITTYGMLGRYAWLKEKEWDLLILDEAQAIKNPGTKQTKAAKAVKARQRIAMTGTPIENRLSDLWSLFDFLNKGLLGTPKEFSDYVKRLKDDTAGYSGLKKAVSPFILRRLKTDKSVIADLPDKVEMKTYSNLTKKQAALYTSLVKDLEQKLREQEEGIERKGLVLASIMKLKQICNHPDQYLGQDLYDEAESGKFEILRELCGTIYEKRERVLVFTQFKEIIDPMKEFLETIFEHEGMILHGGVRVKERKKIVDKFQGSDYVPFLILSLKAGGVGLNLTSANHVIHFDRWWNPAVENQATDRAFRIGQNKKVIVHKIITKGTIEEKIDIMIEDKIKLSNDIISESGEKLITEMDSRELIRILSLS